MKRAVNAKGPAICYNLSSSEFIGHMPIRNERGSPGLKGMNTLIDRSSNPSDQS